MFRRLFVFAALLLALPQVGWCHFLWLVPPQISGDGKVHVYFSEGPSPDDPDLLKKVEKAQVAWITPQGAVQPLKTELGPDSLMAQVEAMSQPAQFVLQHDYGVLSRGENTFLLKYAAKAPAGVVTAGRDVAPAKLPLDVTAKVADGKLVCSVLWNGKPAAKDKIVVKPDDADKFEGETSDAGEFAVPLASEGVYAIRVGHVDPTAGELNGEAYASVRYYTTLTISVKKSADDSAKLPDVPQGITSFGGAVIGNDIYAYGGHWGGAHHYSDLEQSNELWRLNVKDRKWEQLAGGPRLTGLALVADAGKLYRVGGFQARNKDGEDDDLWSSNSAEMYDPETNTWTKLPDLPEGRSSHDAAVLDHKLYVFGGWNMAGGGGKGTTWHNTGLVLDLQQPAAGWKTIENVPFTRRALSVAAHQGKLYLIGGMQEKGGPTTAVNVYNPADNSWSAGPALPGEKGMEGFGNSSFGADGKLLATTYSGGVYALSADGSAWEKVQNLAHPRFFHRLLPTRDYGWIVVAGAHMSSGKVVETEVVK